MDDNEIRIADPAFGQIRIGSRSGGKNLFMVDYPQGHYINLEISLATLYRRGAADWVHANKEIISVSLSEVQFARLITSTNTEGVPCTLERYRDPQTGEWQNPKLPDKHGASTETFAEDVKARAKASAEGLKSALATVEALIKTPGSIRKGDLEPLRDALYHANMQLGSNLPYVVECAENAINVAAESGKAEIEAHADYVLDRIGRQALGAHLAAALAGGADPKDIGRLAIEAVDKQNLGVRVLTPPDEGV